MNSFQVTISDICMCSLGFLKIDFAAFFNILKMSNKSSPQSLTSNVLYTALSDKFCYFGDSDNDGIRRTKSTVL